MPQAVAWRQAYPDHGPFIMNVNLSGKQLRKPDVVERVREILEKAGMPADELKIEITESVMMEDAARAIDKLTQLKSLGVKLALDDFGTGYSSMAILSSFPLDTVKIDRAFISRLGVDAEAVVSAIILPAKSLLFDVAGEDIETSEQLMSLQGLGCDIGQGFLFGRPLNNEDLEDRMTRPRNSYIKHYSETDLQLIERLLAGVEASAFENLWKAA